MGLAVCVSHLERMSGEERGLGEAARDDHLRLKGLHGPAVHFRGQPRVHCHHHSLRCLQTQSAVDVQKNVVSALVNYGVYG